MGSGRLSARRAGAATVCGGGGADCWLGGLAVVSKITGLARSTINRGEDDIDAKPLPKGRVRCAGGGRRAVCENDPGPVPALISRSLKREAEQTHRMLVDSEADSRRILADASSDDLKAAFDENFIDLTNELINRFGELQSTELWVLRERKESIDAARRQLAVLKNRIYGCSVEIRSRKSARWDAPRD